MGCIAKFWSDESGATVIEYGVLIAILGMSIVGAASGGFLSIENKFLYIANVVRSG